MPASSACVLQRCHNSSTGASRKTVGTLNALSRAAFSSFEKAPPPSATTRRTPVLSSSSTSRSAARSACRNASSPESRKISATLRLSRRSIRSSRSSKTQSRCRPKAWPTVLFPAPMNPTKKTAVACVPPFLDGPALDRRARRAAGNVPAAALPADRFLRGSVLPDRLERCDFFFVAICLCVS